MTIKQKGLLIYTDENKLRPEDQKALHQVYEVKEKGLFGNNLIAIMPDYHLGKGCVIGFTAELDGVICPNIIGVDIGCGVTMCRFKSEDLRVLLKEEDNNACKKEVLKMLHKSLMDNIHTGNRKISDEYLKIKDEAVKFWIKNVMSIDAQLIINLKQEYKDQIGTLGGGNHFIELGYVEMLDEFTLTVHSGSRRLGKTIGDHFSNKAYQMCKDMKVNISKDLAYFPINSKEGNEYREEHDLAVRYAKINRRVIMDIALNIIDSMFKIEDFPDDKKFKYGNWFQEHMVESIHNYIDIQNMVRKGAISASPMERVVIPFNMHYGVIYGLGKGNRNWNYSAPHGAGRARSTSQSKKLYEEKNEDLEEMMKGIVTNDPTKVKGELPYAYKDPNSIIPMLEETVEIKFTSKPILNIKGE